MTASIDREGCIGCGLCEQTAPEVFEVRDGKAEVICDTIAPHCEEDAKTAAAQCPVLVIHIDG